MKDGYEECWLCGKPLNEEETQYCVLCELKLLKEISAQLSRELGESGDHNS